MESLSGLRLWIEGNRASEDCRIELLGESIKIFDVDEYGLKGLSPSTIIKKQPGTGDIELYDVDSYGLIELSPFKVIRREGEEYKVYGVDEYGLRDFIPKRMITEGGQSKAFGILLLPSVKAIRYDPGNVRIKEIREVKDHSEGDPRSREWLRSSPRKKEP